MWLICGLGNPGKKYEKTRHNVGFMLVDDLVKNYKLTLIKNNTTYKLFKGLINKKECLVCKPLNYINMSGKVVSDVKNYFKISKSKIIIVHDDLDLLVGKIKIKIGGGNAGHNGLLSIDQHIGKDYMRLRVGIGHPGNKNLVQKYVLSKFIKKEYNTIDQLINLIKNNFEYLFQDKELFLNKIYSNIVKK